MLGPGDDVRSADIGILCDKDVFWPPMVASAARRLPMPTMSHLPRAAQPAGLIRRLMAMVYDSLLLFAVLAFAGALWALTLGIPEDGNLWYFTYLLLVACGFFSGFWMKGGQTLGMKTWRLRVETDQGQTLGLKQALLRFFAAILAWLPAGLGFLWMLVDPKRKALHDHISGTRIVTLPKPQK